MVTAGPLIGFLSSPRDVSPTGGPTANFQIRKNEKIASQKRTFCGTIVYPMRSTRHFGGRPNYRVISIISDLLKCEKLIVFYTLTTLFVDFENGRLARLSQSKKKSNLYRNFIFNLDGNFDGGGVSCAQTVCCQAVLDSFCAIKDKAGWRRITGQK